MQTVPSRSVFILCVALLLSAATCVQAQTTQSAASRPARVLPLSDYEPRTYEEWQERRVIESDSPTLYVEAFPENAFLFEITRDRLDHLGLEYAGADVVYDNRLAQRFIDDLYLDVGDPILNTRSQAHLIRIIADVAPWPEERLPSAARGILVDGLLEYAGVGGGQFFPITQAALANAIERLAKKPNKAVTECVERLLWDAFLWAEEVRDETQRSAVYPPCLEHWGDVFWLYAYEVRLPRASLPEKRPESYQKAAAAIAALLQRKDQADAAFLDPLRDATRGASERFDDRRLSDDLLNRLFLAYRLLLERRPTLHVDSARFVDQQLLEAAQSPDRLNTDRLLKLWTRAVKALGDERISDEFKAFLRRRLENGELPPPQQAAFQAAASICK